MAVSSDNTAATARELGTLSSTPTTVSDFVGNSDTQDYSRFTIARASDVTLRLNGLSSNANVHLLDSLGRIVTTSQRMGSQSEEILWALDAGAYYARVYQYSGDTNYNLTLSAVMNDNSTAGARELGTIATTPTTASGFVGWADAQDFCRFTVAQSSDVRMQLSGLSANTTLFLTDSQGQTITSQNSYAINVPLDAGTYFARIRVGAGETNYVLSLSAVVNDNTTATARNIGALSATATTVSGSVVSFHPQSVSLADPQDYCRFTIAQPSDVRLRLNGLSWNADLQLLNAQGGVLVNSARIGNATEDIGRALEAGTYYARVTSQSTNATNYNLTLSAVVNDNSIAGARDLGTIGLTPTKFSDVIGNSDTQDYYRFTISQPCEVGLSTSAATASVVTLFDGQGQFITDSSYWGVHAGELRQPLHAGTYFVSVRQINASADIPYGLTIVDRGSDNSIDTVRDLGTLSSTPTTVRDFVGLLDTQDHFRFTLTQARNVRVQLSGLSDDADVQLLDAQGRVVASSIRYGTTSEDFTASLSAGTYFIRVVRFSGNTNYDLTLSP